MSWDRAERRSSGLTAALPKSYVGVGKRRSTPGGSAVPLFDPLTGFFTLPVLVEFIQYEIDSYSQTLTHDRFVTPMCIVAIGVDALAGCRDDGERDRLLRVVGEVLHRATRTADRLAHHGGAFTALLRRTLADNVREFYAPRVGGMAAEALGEAGAAATLCLGVSSLSEHLVRDPADMIAKAQHALEAARRRGPGSVAVYDLHSIPLEKPTA